MFQCGENDRRVANDWRPEIHDSDGLSLWRGNGEWIWRPLVNPPNPRVNSYFDENPRGFGLLQRDRSFDHYQDDGAYYHRRPSLWVEPKATASGGWGKGAVQLVELPAADETFDNIVAFWNPADKPQPGQELLFSYRLHWGGRMPFAPALAQVVATRTGIGGVVGQKRKYFSWRFAVDFAGGQLAALPKNAKVEPVISTSRALEPSDGPTTPLRSSRSISRPARENPTRSLRWSIEVDPSCDRTMRSIAASTMASSSSSKPAPVLSSLIARTKPVSSWRFFVRLTTRSKSHG